MKPENSERLSSIYSHQPARCVSPTGADFFDRLQPEDTARRLIKRLESLGYHMTLQSASTDAMP